MYVCVCNAVTERQVYKAIDDGAKTVKDLNRQLGVGAECGSCIDCAKNCLKTAAQKGGDDAKTSNVIEINRTKNIAA